MNGTLFCREAIMVRTKLPPHVNGFIDRYGRARYYVRRPGHKNVRLPGLPWSPELTEAARRIHQPGKCSAKT